MLPPEAIQLLAQLSFSTLLAVLIMFAIQKLAPLAQQQSSAYDRLAAALESMQKASNASEKAIGGLAETQSLNGASQLKALELIATSVNTSLDRQKQYGDATMETRSTSAQTLASVTTLGTQVTGMEEMVGEVLRVALDIKDIVKDIKERPPLTASDIDPLSKKLHETELNLLRAIEKAKSDTPSEPLVVKVPEGTVAVDIQVEKEEVKP